MCTPCGAGYRRLLNCEAGDSICKECDPDTYSFVEKNINTYCQQCTLSCDIKHQVITQPCTPISNSVCQCKNGYFLPSKSDIACERHKPCPEGTGVKTKGTPISNTECEACPSGQFSAVDSTTDTCLPHNTCSNLGGIKTKGNHISDNVCVDSIAQTGVSSSQVLIYLLGSVGVLAVLIFILYLVYRYLKKTNRWNSFQETVCHPHRHWKNTPRNNLGGAEITSRHTVNGGSIDVVISSANIKLSDTNSDIVRMNTLLPSQTKLSAANKKILLSDSVDDNCTLLPSAPAAEPFGSISEELWQLAEQISPHDVVLSRLEGALTDLERASLFERAETSTPQQITYKHFWMWMSKNPDLDLKLALSDAISQLSEEASVPPSPTSV